MKPWSFYVLPGCCVCCHCDTQASIDLCAACQQQLSQNRQACERCALPQPQTALMCASYQSEPPAFRRVYAPLQYTGVVIDMIHRFKFLKHFPSGRVLTDQLIQLVTSKPMPDLVLPVPTYWRKRLSRGFNPAEHMAQQLGVAFKLPVKYKVLKRTSLGQVQKRLSRSQRMNSMQGLYDVVRPDEITGRHVVLVDDVVTTGATANAISSLLMQAGALSVDVWALARTPYNDSHKNGKVL